MIVVDASVVVPALFDPAFLGQLVDVDPIMSAPEILDLEILSFLRREEARRLGEDTTATALAVAAAAPIERRSLRGLLQRIWELRHNLTPYDAAYVALAEGLGVPLVTGDRRLASAPEPRCEIRLLTG